MFLKRTINLTSFFRKTISKINSFTLIEEKMKAIAVGITVRVAVRTYHTQNWSTEELPLALKSLFIFHKS